MNPLFSRLSQVRILLCSMSQRKVLIFVHSLESQMLFSRWGFLSSSEKLAFRPHASLIVKVPLGECPIEYVWSLLDFDSAHKCLCFPLFQFLGV
jgi:hypothetical protein